MSHPGPDKILSAGTPNRPIGILTPTPPGTLPARNLGGFEIVEETVSVKSYSSDCEECRRQFHHRDRATLLHNIAQHYQRWHSGAAENRLRLEYVKKELGRIRRRLNRRR